MGRLTTALGRVRKDLAGLLDEAALRELCRGQGLRWRERVLDPVTTIHLFLTQILHRNTACAHMPRIAGRSFTASAYCQARARLPLRVCQALLRRLAENAWPPTQPAGAGHRTWLVNGTGVSMPDTPALQKAFGQPAAQRPGCGFPVAKVLALFDSATGMLRALHAAPLGAHDLSQVPLIHPEMRPGDILIGDRAFGSFAHLAVLAGRGLHGLFRMHQKRVVDFTPGRATPPRWQRKKLSGRPRSRWVRSLGPDDQVVEWYRPYPRAEWLSAADYAALPLSLPVRELRYKIDRPGFRVKVVTLATTLLDPEAYPAEELAKMYLGRWQIEVCQADYVSSDTLYRCPGPSHSGRLGVIGAGPMVSSTPRARPGTTFMRRHIERHLPPASGSSGTPGPPERPLGRAAGSGPAGSPQDARSAGRPATAIAPGGAGGGA